MKIVICSEEEDERRELWDVLKPEMRPRGEDCAVSKKDEKGMFL